MSDPAFIDEVKATLLNLSHKISLLTPEEYTAKIQVLSNASVGEHSRHIIEHFQQLMEGYSQGLINYDKRKRDVTLQTEVQASIKAIATISSRLNLPDKPLYLTTLYNSSASHIHSSYTRELLFNVEHCIHHQAMIRTGLLYLGKSFTQDEFGVAKSTVEYQKQCAQ